MDYSQLEKMISTYNEYVHSMNNIIDNEIANNQIDNAPYEAFELMRTTDDNPNHLPYLYIRFVYLPYHVNSEVDPVPNESQETEREAE